MRKIKRIFKHLKVYLDIKETIISAHTELKHYFGNDISIKLCSIGGEDLNYTLSKNNKIFGIYRQCVSSKFSVAVNAKRPIQRENKELRIQKEAYAYTHGGQFGLTPKLLYEFQYGVVCEYIDGERLWNTLQQNKKGIWALLIEVIKVYAELHSLGISHLDATLKNCIFDKSDQKIKVFDFEFYAVPELDFMTQQAYDFIRIIEHSLRIIPSEDQCEYDALVNLLVEIVPMEVKLADLSKVDHLIHRIKKLPIYKKLKHEVFYNL